MFCAIIQTIGGPVHIFQNIERPQISILKKLQDRNLVFYLLKFSQNFNKTVYFHNFIIISIK